MLAGAGSSCWSFDVRHHHMDVIDCNRGVACTLLKWMFTQVIKSQPSDSNCCCEGNLSEANYADKSCPLNPSPQLVSVLHIHPLFSLDRYRARTDLSWTLYDPSRRAISLQGRSFILAQVVQALSGRTSVPQLQVLTIIQMTLTQPSQC